MQIDKQMTNIAINEGLAGVYAMLPHTALWEYQNMATDP